MRIRPHNRPSNAANPAKVILAVAASDVHVVANHLIAARLRGAGYEVINLGAATPTQEIIECWQSHKDALAIAIGSLNGHAVQDLADLAELKKLYQVACPVIVGGNLSVGSVKNDGEGEALRENGADYVLKDAEELLALLEDLSKRDAAAEQGVFGLAESIPASAKVMVA